MIVEPQLDVPNKETSEKGDDVLYEKFSNWENRFLFIEKAEAGFEVGESITITHIEKTPTGRTCVWFEDQFGTMDFFFPEEGDFVGVEPEKPEGELTQVYIPDEATLGLKNLLTNNEAFFTHFPDGRDKGVEAIFDILSQNDILKAITNNPSKNSKGRMPHQIAFGDSQITGTSPSTLVIKHHDSYSVNPPNIEKAAKRYTGTNETRLLEILFRAATTEKNPTEKDKKILELWPNMMRVAIERAKLLERRTELISEEIMTKVSQIDLVKDKNPLAEINDTLEEPINSLLWNASQLPNVMYRAATDPEVCEELFGVSKSDFDKEWMEEVSVLTKEEVIEINPKYIDKRKQASDIKILMFGDKKREFINPKLKDPKAQEELTKVTKTATNRYANLASTLVTNRYQPEVIHQSPTIQNKLSEFPRFSKEFKLKSEAHPILGDVAISITNEKRPKIKPESGSNVPLNYSPNVMRPFIGTPNMPNSQLQFYVEDGTTMGFEVFTPSIDNKIPPINQQILDFLKNEKVFNQSTPRAKFIISLEEKGLVVRSGKHYISFRISGSSLNRQELAKEFSDAKDKTPWVEADKQIGIVHILEKLGLMDISSIAKDKQDIYSKIMAPSNFGYQES